MLAAANRFPATLSNVAAYLGNRPTVDAELAVLLTAVQTIDVSAGTSPLPEHAASAEQVAVSILNAGDELPDAQLRVALAASIGLDGAVALTGCRVLGHWSDDQREATVVGPAHRVSVPA